jgi:hypothetical protein
MECIHERPNTVLSRNTRKGKEGLELEKSGLFTAKSAKRKEFRKNMDFIIMITKRSKEQRKKVWTQ